MNEQAMKFRFGIFVLAVLILLAVLTTLFGGVPRYFTQTDPYTIVVSNAQNVTPGAPVRRSGVKIGEVRSVELDNATGKVKILILVEHGYTIPQGDRATIMRGVFGGDVSIDFLPPDGDEAPVDEAVAPQGPAAGQGVQPPAKDGPPPQPGKGEVPVEPKKGGAQVGQQKKTPPPIPVGSTIPGFTAPEAQQLVERAGELLPPAKASLAEMEKVLKKLDKMMPLLEETVREFRDVGKATNRLIPALGKTNDELQTLTKAAQQAVPELKKTSEEFQVTARIWGKLGERLDVLVQTNELKINKTIDQLADTTKRLNQVLSDDNQKSINQTLKNAADATTQLSRILNDENVKNIDQTLRNARLASQQFDSISKNTDEMIKDARVTIKNLNSTAMKADEVFGNLQKITGPFSNNSPNLIKNLNESSTTLNTVLGEFRELMRDYARSDGTVHRLIADPGLYNNLNEAACMVTRLLPRLDRILGDVEIFSDKIARHPESLGIGGVVRPGNGLKEAPTVLPWREPTEPRWRIWPH